MTYPIKAIGAAAAAAVVTVILSGPPALAWHGLAKPQITAGKSTPVAERRRGRGPEARIQDRIAELHERLQITAAQEDKFKAMADVMTANAQAMSGLLQQRAADNVTSAEDSLQWYSRLVDAHSDSLKKFIPVFSALYATLSDSQKRTADRMFARFNQRPMRGRGRRGR